MKHEQFWMTCAAACVTAAAMGGVATAAFAQQERAPIATIIGERPADLGKSVRVTYRDLNLASAHDVRILKDRVGDAARFVCETNKEGLLKNIYSECLPYAWDGARPQIASAVNRAREVAKFGSSSIPLVAISVGAR